MLGIDWLYLWFIKSLSPRSSVFIRPFTIHGHSVKVKCIWWFTLHPLALLHQRIQAFWWYKHSWAKGDFLWLLVPALHAQPSHSPQALLKQNIIIIITFLSLTSSYFNIVFCILSYSPGTSQYICIYMYIFLRTLHMMS